MSTKIKGERKKEGTDLSLTQQSTHLHYIYSLFHNPHHLLSQAQKSFSGHFPNTKGTPMTLLGKRFHPGPKENLYSDWLWKALFPLSEVRCGSALLSQCFAEHPASRL